MSERVLFKLFVEEKNVGKAINIMTLAGISGFFLHNYKGLSPDMFKNLSFSEFENFERIYELISKVDRAVIIGTVVKNEKAKKIEELLKEKMGSEKWTVIKIPILKVKVHRV